MNCWKKAALSVDELSKLGYDNNQIAILKNYDGQAIEDAPELRGVFAGMTAKFFKSSASTSSLKVRVLLGIGQTHPLLQAIPLLT